MFVMQQTVSLHVYYKKEMKSNTPEESQHVLCFYFMSNHCNRPIFYDTESLRDLNEISAKIKIRPFD